MKKCLVCAMALLLVSSMLLTTPALATAVQEYDMDASDSKDKIMSPEKITADISDAIAAYYYSKDVSGVFPEDGTFAADIASYLSDKMDVQQYVTQLYDTDKENYSAEVTLVEYNVSAKANIISMKYQVQTTYNYVGCDFETTSSEIVEIQYDLDEGCVVDMNVPMDYYDEFVRADQAAASRTSVNAEFALTPEVLAKQDEIKELIGARYADVDSLPAVESVPSNVSRSSTLNNTAIVNWARNNYNKDQPTSGSSSISYYDFSEITNAYDCTNFVSHAILAGGAKMYDPGGSGIGSTGWYYRNVNNRSVAWAGVEYFYNYMTSNTRSNTAAGQAYLYSHNGAWWSPGYVMQFNFDGTGGYDHSTIVTEKRYSSDGARCYAYVTGRTGDGVYNNNKSADEMSPVNPVRALFIYNN